MQILYNLDGLRQLPTGSSVTIGNFDGFHRGHQVILARLLSFGQPTTVITFDPHPKTVFDQSGTFRTLVSIDEKLKQFEVIGIDAVVILKPEPAVLNLLPREFWDLLRQSQPKHLVVGQDFHFGKNRAGSVDQLQMWGREDAIAIDVVDDVAVTVKNKKERISTSLIKDLLAAGDRKTVELCLGEAIHRKEHDVS